MKKATVSSWPVRLCFIGVAVAAAEGAGPGTMAANQPAASAAWAEVDITPPLGIALGGRGVRFAAADQILDPLKAQVLLLTDAKGTKFALVSLDLVGLSHELGHRLRQAVVSELGVDANLVVVNCSHTHSGPLMYRCLFAGTEPVPQIETDYYNSVVIQVIQACRQAAKTVKPVHVKVFWGTSRVAINRRARNEAGAPIMGPNPAGPIDEKVWVMQLSHPGGRPAAIVFSYACHPVIVCGFAYTQISAEFPGVVRRVLRSQLGEEVHVQFVQGPAGNVRPRILSNSDKMRFRKSKPEDLEAVGSGLAHDVLDALDTQGEPLALDLAGSMDHPFLRRGEPPSRSLYEGWLVDEKRQYRRGVARYWLERYDAGEGFAKGDAWPVGLIRLADNQWVCCIAGEPCVEWGPKVAKWLAPRRVVMWGYCHSGRGYLPTEELLPEGGYEVAASNYWSKHTPAPFAPGIHEAVRKSLLRQAAFIEADVE